ncbi:type II toxin-antitoxin system mRNA interferase toxin, RelE/StbE family [Candidatus Gottesmanbacteria bacterium]|nr:type II toxin-antitoxin system mRNA interferase toxin, RelE/StbE family [Candidatus Gottesmanbacteria bacterium]
MKVQFSKLFLKRYKKADVRIRHSIDKQIRLFRKDPTESSLNNHALKKEYEGLRSIDITGDYRAIFEEVKEPDRTFAYFVTFGTHKELYSVHTL